MVSNEMASEIKDLLSNPFENISEISRITGISKVSLYNIRKGLQLPTERTYLLLKNYFESDKIEDDELKESFSYIQKNLLSKPDNSAYLITKNSIVKVNNYKFL